MKATPMLYLDIDGTVRQGKDDPLDKYVNGPEDVIVFPEAADRIAAWRRGGGRAVGCSNQGGIALGIVPLDLVVVAMHETQMQLAALDPMAALDHIVICQHHPDAKTPEFSRCWCRKPRAGMVFEAATECNKLHTIEFYPPHLGLFVGDRPEDAACAQAANLDFMWAHEWRAS